MLCRMAAPSIGTHLYVAADKLKAERVLRDLGSARSGDRDSPPACLQRLRNEVACERASDLPRMQAWQSIRTLYDALNAGTGQDLWPQWQDAIAKTTAWHDALPQRGTIRAGARFRLRRHCSQNFID